MRLHVITLLSLATLVFTGCGAKLSSNALDGTSAIPKMEEYTTKTKVLDLGEAEVTKKLKQMKAFVMKNNRTKRRYHLTKEKVMKALHGQYLYDKGKDVMVRGRGSYGSAYVSSNLMGKGHRLKSEARDTVIEPAEVVSIEDTITDPNNKKFLVELEEYDIENACGSGAWKFLHAFENRYLYFGAVKVPNGWQFYVTYPVRYIHDLGDVRGGGFYCKKYYVGSEHQADFLGHELYEMLSKEG